MGFVVAAIVDEPAEVLDRFVGWYLAQGAERVDLYFDNPNHPNIARFAALPRVSATPCTTEFLRKSMIPAEAPFTRRQNAVLSYAYHRLPTGWLLNVDADELMYARGQSLADWLETVSEPATIRVETAEQVLCSGSDHVFRLPINRGAVKEIYGAQSHLFRRRFGLIGHADGKSFHRAGRRDLRLRQHWAEDYHCNEVKGARLTAADGVYLLHYIAPNYAVWRAKLGWRLHAHGFTEPVKNHLLAIQEQGGDPEPAYRALFDLLHCLTPAQEAALAAAGGVLRLPAGFGG